MKKNTTYKIIASKNGEKFIKFSKGIIPADIAGLAAGPDSWLRDIQCQCEDCKQMYPLSQLQGNGRWCEECQCASLEEECVA